MLKQNNDMKTLDVLIIGAGFAGICAGIRLDRSGIKNFRIYDKADGIGGTWWNNTYPGAACDVPSHLYCYSFEPNPNWSRQYAPQAEIQAYIEGCADKYGLRDRIHLGRHIRSLSYDDETANWHAVFDDGEELVARFVINGSGGLHKPLMPDFKDRDQFAGTTMHTAEWDNEFDVTGKDIAMIGSAASAIQVLPAIAPDAKSVTLYQRTPNYVLPRNDFEYSDRQKKWFARLPLLSRLYRTFIFYFLEYRFFPIIVKQDFRAKRSEEVKRYIQYKVRGRKQRKAALPQYEMGCKRILISDDFYDALNEDNVEVISDPIDHMTKTGIVSSDGTERNFDAIIYATGYDMQGHMFSIDVTGANGQNLREIWKDRAESYLGVMVPGLPNYFMVTGPNTGVGTTSVVFMIEQSVNWIVRCIRKAGNNRIVKVSEQANSDYNRKIQSALADTVWATSCNSWYKKSDGSIETLYPFDARTFRRQMRRIDKSHVHFEKAPAPMEAAQ
ncbi:MAG: NAD(P)/FAD-dependent oxidoreductase [Pseudomonadota bacterium]